MSSEPSAKSPTTAKKKPKEPLWLLYVAAFLVGVLLLSEAVDYTPLTRISAKLGIALVYSALSLLTAGKKRSGIGAAVLVWLGVIVSFFV